MSSAWPATRLKFVVDVDPVERGFGLSDDTPVSFLPMEAIGEDGSVDLSRTRPLMTVREGYTGCRNGDVVVAKITPCFENGKGALLTGLENGVGFGTTELFVLRPSPVVDARFLYYLTASDAFRQPATAQMYGAGGQKRVPPEFVCDFRINLPAVAQQRAIADFLDRETAKIEALIQAKERALCLQEEKRQSTIDAAVGGRLSAGASIPAPTALAWAERIPADWQVWRLKTLARVQSGIALGRTFDGIRTTRVPYIRVANVQDGYLDLSDVAEIEVPESEVARYALQPGDLLMNEGGDFDKLGRGAIWSGEISPCIHQNHVFAVRPHRMEDGSWLELFNRSTFARHYFILRSKQSTNLASVSSTNLKSLPVLWPPRIESLRLLTLVHQASAAIESMSDRTRRSIGLLHEHRSALITAAVTGQIDITNPARTELQKKHSHRRNTEETQKKHRMAPRKTLTRFRTDSV